jgi:hypothetical protein
MNYQKFENLDWEKLKDFYESLEEYEQDLLDRAIKYKSQLIETMSNSSFNIVHQIASKQPPPFW